MRKTLIVSHEFQTTKKNPIVNAIKNNKLNIVYIFVSQHIRSACAINILAIIVNQIINTICYWYTFYCCHQINMNRILWLNDLIDFDQFDV